MILDFALALLLQSALDVTPEGVSFDDRVATYPISGTTTTELEQQMVLEGLVDPVDQQHYAGDTRWEIRWQYSMLGEEGVCKLSQIDVVLSTLTTVPEWTDAASGPAALRAQWTAFLSGLKAHEKGHRDSGLRAAIQVRLVFERAPRNLDCDSLKKAIEVAAQVEVDRAKRADAAYDAYTRHGQTQGAALR